MVEKIEKSIPWFAILAICFLVAFGIGVILKEVIADTAAPSVTVGNVAPTIGTVILNGGNPITVTDNSSIRIGGTTTFTDDNSYGDVNSVTSTLFLNNTTCSSGVTDAQWCYYMATCVTSSCSGLSCVVTCSSSVWFVAEPSDGSSSYASYAWQMDITVMDSGGNNDTGSSSEELKTAAYLDIGSSISYGTVNPGATSTNQALNATNTGNSAINTELSGVNMETGGATASIAVGQQKYATDTIITWNNMGTALTGGATEFNVDLSHPNATPSDSGDLLYWVIMIPTSTMPGAYNGTNTIGAVWAGP